MDKQQTHTLWQIVKYYFNVMPDKEDESLTVSQINSGISFHGANLWVLIFAIFIASLGLNVNSTAVIIGAMLISPLMGPIIGMGLAVGISDLELLKRSAKNYLVATGISVLTATIYFLLTPLNEAQSELLARTSPTLYDVLIALCGGAAGILAISTKGKGNVIPGVAIATALMPPLCTAGYGLAMGKAQFFFGAFYLFFINTVFISLSTFLGVRMMHFHRKQIVNASRVKVVNRYILAVVVLTMLPASYMTMKIIGKSVADNNVRKFVKKECTFPGTQVVSQSTDDKTLNLVLVGKTISNNQIDHMRSMMGEYQLGGYRLNIIQGSQSDSVLIAQTLNSANSNTEASKQKIMEQSARIQALETCLEGYERYTLMSAEIGKEASTVWPDVMGISLTRASEWKNDSTRTSQYVLAVVGCKRTLGANERARMQSWLKERTHADSVRLVVTR